MSRRKLVCDASAGKELWIGATARHDDLMKEMYK